MMIKRMVTASAVALAALTMGLLVAPAPASASTLVCSWSTISWQTGGSDWGRARFCGGSVTHATQTDDVKTDGYCVHVEIYDSGYWHYESGSQSCGSIVTSPAESGAAQEVRLVRGDPLGCITDGPPNCNGVGINYFTLYKIRF